MLRSILLPIKSLIFASSCSHLYLLIKDARSFEHKSVEIFYETLLINIKIKYDETYEYMTDGFSVIWLKVKVIFYLCKIRENIHTLRHRTFSNLQWCNILISTTESF